MEKTGEDAHPAPDYAIDDNVGQGEVLNASGHVQELERNFSLLSVCSVGITVGAMWTALGGSIVRRSYFSMFADGIWSLTLSMQVTIRAYHALE